MTAATAQAPATGLTDAELRAYAALRRRWRARPVAYARERLGMEPTEQQAAILRAIAAPGAKVSVRSGHGVGKSAVSAAIIWWFLETRDYARIACTAPTAHQLRDILWAEVAKWRRHADELSRRRGDHPRLWLSALFRTTTERIFDPSAKEEWFAVARTSSRDQPEALQGFHAPPDKLLFVIDEASGVPDEVFQVAEGALSSPGSRLLMLSNPTRNTGYFADSHKRNRHQFTAIHLHGSDSPLVDPRYREELVARWGEDSNVVLVRADGEFPRQDDDALIPLDYAEPCITREPYRVEPAETRVGVDPARYGDDRTVLVVRRGRNLLACEVYGRTDAMQIVAHARRLAREHRAAGIWVGVTGFHGVADRLRELGEHVVEVEEGAGPPTARHDGAVPGCMRDWLWLEARRWLREEEPSWAQIDRRIAEELAAELTAVTYRIDSSGRLKVQPKDEIKRRGRLGRSPDIADALLMTLAPDRRGERAVSAERLVF